MICEHIQYELRQSVDDIRTVARSLAWLDEESWPTDRKGYNWFKQRDDVPANVFNADGAEARQYAREILKRTTAARRLLDESVGLLKLAMRTDED